MESIKELIWRFRIFHSSGRLNYTLFLLSVFTLPISRHIFVISLWPWVLTWITEGKFKEKFTKQNLSDSIYGIVFTPGIFLMLIISLLWTNDINEGLNRIGISFCFILIPLLLIFSSDYYKKASSFKNILLTFVAGVVSISVFLLTRALLYSISFNTGKLVFDPIINVWENVFFFSQFSYLMHPTYLGLMVLFAIAICIIDIFTKTIFRKKYYNIIIVSFLLIILLLISSRAIFLAALLLFIILTVSLTKRTIVIFGSGIIVLIAIVSLLVYHPRIDNYFTFFKNGSKESLQSLDIRYGLWESSLNLIKESPVIGLGVGDVQNELEKEYQHLKLNIEKGFNAHNQYLEQWLSTGIFSLLFLIAGLVIPLIYYPKQSDNKIYYLSFVIIISVVFLFESALYRFWAISFVSIFYPIITKNNSRQAREN